VIKEIEVEGAIQTPVVMYWQEIPLLLTLPSTDSTTQFRYILSVDQVDTVAKLNFDSTVTLTADILFTNHTAAFRNIWTQGTIDVIGDLHLNKVIHGSLYYLYTSLPAHPTLSLSDQFSGLSPGGLPNGANATDYQGHVFWDMETWMYPPILVFRPDLARDMLSYRISRMDEAKKRAELGGYSGARFPWESAFTGVEVKLFSFY